MGEAQKGPLNSTDTEMVLHNYPRQSVEIHVIEGSAGKVAAPSVMSTEAVRRR